MFSLSATITNAVRSGISQVVTALNAGLAIQTETLTRENKSIMATLADIMAAVTGLEASEAKIIAALQAESASIASLQSQLAAAIASGDPTAMQAVVDKLNADKAAIDNALAAAAPPAATPPAGP